MVMSVMLDEKDHIKQLDDIQETIGLWHDHDVTIDRLRDFDNDDVDIINSLTQKRDKFYEESLLLLEKL